MRRTTCFLVVLAALACTRTAAADGSHWARVRTPAPGPARVIGFYTNGCFAGGRALPLKGMGWRVLRPKRNRYWGHPAMIAFLERLGKFAADTFGRPVLVADIAQPRGGPITGHASHELGLDADVRLVLLKPAEINHAYLARPPNLSMLTPDETRIDRSRWSARQVRLIRFAARDPAVDRLFVNPVIKRELCRVVPKGSRWLARVVAWYGHRSHMHVRLRCPADSAKCIGQKPINTADDGCGKTLTWWFKVGLPAARAWAKRHKVKPKTPARRGVAPLPTACDAVIGAE